ncbi:hypothetical protein Hanom_Chr12g01092361 [Helianthus anomalus]
MNVDKIPNFDCIIWCVFITTTINEVVLEWLWKDLVILVIQIRIPLFPLFSAASRGRANTGGVGSSWMGGEVLPIIPLSCLRAGEGRVFAHLGELRL